MSNPMDGLRFGHNETGEETAMSLEVKPETEQLVKNEIQSGRFQSVDDLIVTTVHAWHENHPAPSLSSTKTRPAGRKSLPQLFAESPLRGLNLDFEREPDYGRDVEL
jgi:hypothetical protein